MNLTFAENDEKSKPVLPDAMNTYTEVKNRRVPGAIKAAGALSQHADMEVWRRLFKSPIGPGAQRRILLALQRYDVRLQHS